MLRHEEFTSQSTLEAVGMGNQLPNLLTRNKEQGIPSQIQHLGTNNRNPVPNPSSKQEGWEICFLNHHGGMRDRKPPSQSITEVSRNRESPSQSIVEE